jgi:hypothetical protein
MKRFSLALLLTFSLYFLTDTVTAQCPMCKANVESNRRAANQDSKRKVVGSGLNQGILFLLAMPYIAAVGMGVYWYRNQRKKKSGGEE